MLSEQDRQWVDALIRRTVAETALATSRTMDERIARAQEHCPYVLRLRWFVLGVGVTCGLGGFGGGVAAARLVFGA